MGLSSKQGPRTWSLMCIYVCPFKQVPFEEGYVKLRGFPKTVTKQDIISFFKVGGWALMACTGIAHADAAPRGVHC